MTTVGEILSAARQKQKITLDQAEKATKIRQKFLIALERNEFHKLPPGIFTRGFVRNYATYLGLSPNEILAFYRRQVNEEKNLLTHKSPLKPLNAPKIPTFFSPINVGIGILLLLFVTYLLYSYIRFASSPALIIHSPAQNSITSNEQIEIIGKTDPDATVTINNQPINTDENGNFSVKVNLTDGFNNFTITATNKFGRQTTTSRSLRLERER